jgi:hypothetical protein
MTKATKYIARLDGEIVGTRKSAAQRVYTHAVVLNGHGRTNYVATWCGRLDLAQREQRKHARYGYRADIVPAEVVGPRVKALPSFDEAIQDPKKARALLDASKGGAVQGITEDHRFELNRVATATDADAALDDFNYVGSRHHY